jgi:hypothetical protein
MNLNGSNFQSLGYWTDLVNYHIYIYIACDEEDTLTFLQASRVEELEAKQVK